MRGARGKEVKTRKETNISCGSRPGSRTARIGNNGHRGNSGDGHRAARSPVRSDDGLPSFVVAIERMPKIYRTTAAAAMTTKTNDYFTLSTPPKWPPPRSVARANATRLAGAPDGTVPRPTGKRKAHTGRIAYQIQWRNVHVASFVFGSSAGRTQSSFAVLFVYILVNTGKILTSSRTINEKMTSLERSQQQKRCSLYPYHANAQPTLHPHHVPCIHAIRR